MANRTFKLYAHNELEELRWEIDDKPYPDHVEDSVDFYIRDTDVTTEEFLRVTYDNPLYEVEFTFDADTRKCVEVNVAGTILQPIEREEV